MAAERIDGQSDDLDAALVEFWLDLGHVAELGGAHRGEVLGMREQHHPFVADPVVEADLALGRFRFEIRGSIVDRKSHHMPPTSISRARSPAGEYSRDHRARQILPSPCRGRRPRFLLLWRVLSHWLRGEDCPFSRYWDRCPFSY